MDKTAAGANQAPVYAFTPEKATFTTADIHSRMQEREALSQQAMARDSHQPQMRMATASAEETQSMVNKNMLPGLKLDDNGTDKNSKNIGKLLDQKASPEDRLNAARDLVKNGVTTVDTKDANGKKSSLRLEAEKVGGNKELVHVFAGQGGSEQIALRGKLNNAGAVEKQKAGGVDHSLEGRGFSKLNKMTLTENGKELAAGKKELNPVNKEVKAEKKEAEKKEAKKEAAKVQPTTTIESQPRIEPPKAQPKLESQPKIDFTPRPAKPGDAPIQAKTKEGNKPVVVLDAGHGGDDTGAVVQGVKEKDITNDLTSRVADELRLRNIAVERTNPTGAFVSLDERVRQGNRDLGAIQGRKDINENQADAFISIHANHDGVHNKGGGKFKGFQTYMFKGKENDGTRDLANSIHKSVIDGQREGLDVTDGGVKDKNSFRVMSKTTPPAVLLETGYLTNDKDRANLASPAYRAELAKRIADGIARFVDGRPENSTRKAKVAPQH